jgi:EF hand
MIARTAVFRSLSLKIGTTRSGSAAVRALSMYQPIKFDAIDPDKIFDEIDTTGSGTITREEFKATLSRLRQQDLMKIHEAAAANLKAIDAKMEKLNEIEKGMDDLKKISTRKQDVYNNIGMTTAADIDSLFDEAKMTRRRMKNSVAELKGKLSHTRDVYNNIGFLTAADMDALFPKTEDENTKKAA